MVDLVMSIKKLINVPIRNEKNKTFESDDRKYFNGLTWPK